MTFDEQGAIASPVAPNRERIEWLKRWADSMAISGCFSTASFTFHMRGTKQERCEWKRPYDNTGRESGSGEEVLTIGCV